MTPAASAILLPAEHDRRSTLLRSLAWSYFWLLIFEGVLRKWLLPQYSAPLLVVRDPLVIAIYALALMQGRFPFNRFVIATLVLGVVTLLAAMFGPTSWKIILYGWRTNFLHLPLIFVLPQIFDRRDVERLGQWLLLLAPAIALLVLAQFRAEPGAWVNVGAGGGEGGQIESAYGKVRPPGPFSFVSGMIAYSSLVAAFLIEGFTGASRIKARLAVAAGVALVLCVGLSGSRASVVAVVLVFLAGLFAATRRRGYSLPLLATLALCAVAYLAFSLWSEFRLGLLVHEYRFAAGGVREGLIGRFVSGLTQVWALAERAPLFGFGLGLGTNAGAALATGSAVFLLAEDEWARIVLESGPILGIAFIALRVWIVAHLGVAAFAQMRAGHSLPLLLFATCAISIANGQFGPPTILGFAVFSGGLCLAAARIDVAVAPAPEREQELPAVAAPLPRGRSVYAEKLHAGAEEGSAPR